MNTSQIVPVILLFLAAVSFGQDQKPEGMRGAKPAEAPPAVTLVVGVNEVAGSLAEPGWPLIVSAALVADEGVQVAMPPGLRLRVTDESEKQVAIGFEPVPRPADAKPDQAYYWIASEDATKDLAPGRYNITLVPPEAELKDLRIESGDLRVVNPEPESGPARAADLGQLKIQRALLLDKQEDALAEADRLIAADAKNADAWIAKGDILMMQDKPDEALAAYDSALKLAEEAEDKEPLFVMERRRAAFFRSLEKREVLPATKPAP